MAKYKVRWKGKEIGEFSKEEIESALRSSKMGLLHQVFAGEKWINLKSFIEDFEEEIITEAIPIQNSRDISSIAFFSTGLSFLSPYLCILSIAFAIILFINGYKKNAICVLMLSCLISLAGILFFKAIGFSLFELLMQLNH